MLDVVLGAEKELLTKLVVSQTKGAPAIVTVPPMVDMESARIWLLEQQEALRELRLKLGHVYLRGLPIVNSEDFGIVRDVLIKDRAEYKEKATPRSTYGNDIYSSTDLPSIQSIHLHNENSYTLDFPGVLAFCCIEAPSEGGATTIADVRKVLAAISPPLQARFRRHGWRLVRNYNEHISLPWRTAFNTNDRSEVERYCKKNLIATKWTESGDLRTEQRRPAIISHPVSGEEVWFNHVTFWNAWSLDEDVREVLLDTYGEQGLPFATFSGDGQALSEEDVAQLQEAYDSATYRESWQVGDVMLVDNILNAHGREPFKGGRRILVAMGEPVSLSVCKPSPHASV